MSVQFLIHTRFKKYNLWMWEAYLCYSSRVQFHGFLICSANWRSSTRKFLMTFDTANSMWEIIVDTFFFKSWHLNPTTASVILQLLPAEKGNQSSTLLENIWRSLNGSRLFQHFNKCIYFHFGQCGGTAHDVQCTLIYIIAHLSKTALKFKLPMVNSSNRLFHFPQTLQL